MFIIGHFCAQLSKEKPFFLSRFDLGRIPFSGFFSFFVDTTPRFCTKSFLCLLRLRIVGKEEDKFLCSTESNVLTSVFLLLLFFRDSLARQKKAPNFRAQRTTILFFFARLSSCKVFFGSQNFLHNSSSRKKASSLNAFLFLALSVGVDGLP